ncbi:MAG TPA: dienelactone hydrolase family protein [Thermomicrobiales bacterium]|nr:dienelactone hydrolase family protein [Thermomicrobiales bacterium]
MTTPATLPHAGTPVYAAGAPLETADLVVILVHGRGANAADILGLAGDILPEGAGDRIAFLAPDAEGSVWYPYPFRQPLETNEPWLTGALAKLDALVDHVRSERPDLPVVVGGFSQGACLSLEYLARGSRPVAGVAAFSGALIGPSIADRLPIGNLAGRWVFLGCGDRDQFFTLDVAEDSATALAQAGARVDFRAYPGMGHTINADEIEAVSDLLAGTLPPR